MGSVAKTRMEMGSAEDGNGIRWPEWYGNRIRSDFALCVCAPPQEEEEEKQKEEQEQEEDLLRRAKRKKLSAWGWMKTSWSSAPSSPPCPLKNKNAVRN